MNKVSIMQKELYWKLRNRFLKCRLFWGNKKYKILMKKNNFEYEKQYNKTIYKQLLKELIKGVLTVISLYLIDYVIKKIFNITLFSEIKDYFGINSYLIINTDIFVDVLIGSIGVSGVFLGLYYANISSIFTEKYSNAPKEIRNLFTNEMITNKNISNLINYIIISTLILAFYCIGITPWYVSIVIMFIFTIKIVITFSIIGNRTYEFSDTYSVSEPIYRQIKYYYDNATIFGYRWNDANFQNHYKNLCNKNIEILRIINDFNINETNNNSKLMLNFMSRNVGLLCNYIEKKKFIQYNSKWYKEKYEYKQWYEASESEVSIAISTGTTIEPTKKINEFWVEDELLQINKSCLEKLLEENNIDAVSSYIDIFTQSINYWIQGLNYNKCIQSIIDLGVIIEKYIASKGELEDDLLGLIEKISLMYSEIIVCINKLLREFYSFNGFNYLNIKSYKIKTLLKLGYPMLNNEGIFKFCNSIINEYKIEKKQITSEWYVKEIFYREAYRILMDLNNITSQIYNEFIYNKLCSYLEEKKYNLSMIYLARESEIYNKINITFDLIETIESQLIGYKKQKQISWAKNNVLNNRDIISNNHKNMPLKWVEGAIGLLNEDLTANDNYPDFMGFAYNNICEYILSSIEKNDLERFKIGYDNFFQLCLMYQNIIRDDIRKKSNLNEIGVTNAIISPIIEFLQLSGYAVLIGEFTSDCSWGKYIKEQLELISQKLTNKEKLFEEWVEIAKIKQGMGILLYNRETIQTSWKQRFNRSIIENGLVKYKEMGRFGERILETNSKFLNNVYTVNSNYIDLHIDAYEIFIITNVNKYVEKEKQLIGRWKWDKGLGEYEDE